MTEKTWARMGLAFVFGLAAFCVVSLALLAFKAEPEITLAVLFGTVAGLGVYIYDVRTESNE